MSITLRRPNWSALRWKYIAIATFVAPLVVFPAMAVLFVPLLFVGSPRPAWADLLLGTQVLAVPALAYSYVGMIFVGLPAFFALHSIAAPRLRYLIAASLVPAAAIAVIWSGLFAAFAAWLGPWIAVVAWFIGVRMPSRLSTARDFDCNVRSSAS